MTWFQRSFRILTVFQFIAMLTWLAMLLMCYDNESAVPVIPKVIALQAAFYPTVLSIISLIVSGFVKRLQISKLLRVSANALNLIFAFTFLCNPFGILTRAYG